MNKGDRHEYKTDKFISWSGPDGDDGVDIEPFVRLGAQEQHNRFPKFFKQSSRGGNPRDHHGHGAL